MAVSREAIVDTGLRLLDAHGLSGVSLRRIARELGIQAPTLYWHVSNKRHLLDLMAERLICEVRSGEPNAPRPGEPWWEWLRRHTTATFEVFVAHRDSHLVLAGNRPTRDSLPQIESALDKLVTVGFPAGEAQRLLFSLGSYVGGSVLEWHQEADRQRSRIDDSELLRELADRNRFGLLRTAFAEMSGQPRDATFKYGLQMLITGARVRHAALIGAPPEVVLSIVDELHRELALVQKN